MFGDVYRHVSHKELLIRALNSILQAITTHVLDKEANHQLPGAHKRVCMHIQQGRRHRGRPPPPKKIGTGAAPPPKRKNTERRRKMTKVHCALPEALGAPRARLKKKLRY